ncbi:histidine kinase N-terminal 7TM domain-containing protein [Sulfitobacter sp. 1A13368]|uniref:histidine kinase N-terminal 7TM domain-containing protein n=1 Tax=Sulfitobacter sp. 1A13368 TaxID=3368593 RepID=UPI003747C8E7
MPAVELVIVTATLVTVLGYWVRGHSSLPGKHWFLLAILAMDFWLLSVGVELSATSAACAFGVSRLAWIGFVLLPTFWAFFLYEYALGAKVPRWLVPLCAGLAPALITLAAVTSGWHETFYGPETKWLLSEDGAYVQSDHGPLFFIAITYLYMVIMAAAVVAGRAVRSANPAVRSFFLKLFAATLIPMVANLAYILGGITLFNTDPTPFSFALSLTLVVWLVADNRWIDVNAIARELLFYNSTDPVFVVDPSGAAIETNPAAADLLRREADPEAALSAFGELGPIIRYLAAHGSLPDVTDIQLGHRHFAVRAHAISLGAGQKQVGWAVALLDVTVQKIAAEKAIAAEQMQAQFLATVSHELRTPLTVINGALGLLLQGRAKVSDAQKARLLAKAAGSSETLTTLVNDLIDTQSLSSAEFSIDLHPAALAPLVQKAVARAESLQPEKDIRFRCEMPEAVLTVQADAERLGQVFGNVLSNAVKFSAPGGQVEVSLQQSEGMAHVQVSDSGCGIPPGAEEQVFAPFLQVDGSDTKVAYGSGLGMHITRQILDRHGGSIRYVSAPGVGTTFTISLPLVA